ncbi:hypothetical protein Tco_0037046, partial [Tanacetum coccineum]
NELLQSDNTSALASGFVRSTAILKLLTTDVGGSCPSSASKCCLPTEPSEHNRVEDLDRESPGTATSKFVESVVLCNSSMNSQTVVLRDSSVNLDIIPEKAECSQDHGGNNMLGVATGPVMT